MTAGTPWSDADNARLAVLWAEGAKSGTIAAEMGRTRNGIIGRVHRLHLPLRPSPIPGHVPAKPRPVAPPPPPPVVVAVPLPAPPRLPSVRSCQYPQGHPREPGFRFCEAPVVGAGPYCREHHAAAYIHHRSAA